MSLSDVLGWTGLVALTAGTFYAINKYYIPYAEKLQKKSDKEEKEAGDDPSICDEKE
jgi:hypothetical protein